MADPQVQVFAHPEGQVAQGPQSNAALQLAGALSDVNQDLAPVLTAYGLQQRDKANAQAKLDAMKTAGASFADAVRDGKIEPTQNPWYMQAYEENAAAVRGQAAGSDLITQSQTWAERNDPAAYAQRLQAEMGKLGESYTNVYQRQGFASAAQPLLEQALNQNTALNVARINQEHTQNISTLATTAIQGVVQKNGGVAVPSQVFDAIEPLHQQWIATGGSESAWNTLTINTVMGAAYNANDRASAESILDTLKDTRGGKGPLANIAGPSGQPVAADIEEARYRIGRILDEKATAGLKSERAQTALNGENAVDAAWQHFGAKLLDGSASKADIQDFLLSNKVDPEAVGYAMGKLAENQQKINALGRAQIDLHSNDPSTAQRVLGVYATARTKGLTSDLQSEVTDMVRTGVIDYSEGKDIYSAAQSRSDHLDAEGRADARQGKSDARAEKSATRQAQLDAARQSKEYKGQSLDIAVTTLGGLGDNSIANNPQARASLTTRLNAAEGTWLRAHPDDWHGAQAAVDDELNRYLAPKVQALQRRKAGGSKPTVGGSK